MKVFIVELCGESIGGKYATSTDEAAKIAMEFCAIVKTDHITGCLYYPESKRLVVGVVPQGTGVRRDETFQCVELERYKR